MKAKVIMGAPISSNEMVAIGTEVEIVNGYCGTDGYYYMCKLPNGEQVGIKSDNLEITDFTPYIDWEQRRFEFVKAAMQGLLSNNEVLNADDVVECKEDYAEKVAYSAIHYADALIKELKGE